MALRNAFDNLATETAVQSLITALTSGDATNHTDLQAVVTAITNGTAKVVSVGVATPTTTNVASSATSVTLLAANANARQRIIYNDSTSTLYVKFGATASSTSFTYLLTAGGLLELPTPTYTGRVDGIWTVANGNARCTEVTT